MSFTVDYQEHVIDLSGLKIGVDDKWGMDKAIQRMLKTVRTLVDAYDNDIRQDFVYLLKVDKVHFSEIELYEPLGTENQYVMRYKVLKTSGPIIGFLGFYVDMASGYAVLGGEKDTEVIPLFNMVRYIEAMYGLKHQAISLELFKESVELFKLNMITIQELFESLSQGYNLAIKESNSFMINHFKKLEQGMETTKGGSGDGEIVLRRIMMNFDEILQVIRRLSGVIDSASKAERGKFVEHRHPGQTTYYDDDKRKAFREKVGDGFFKFSLGAVSHNRKTKYYNLSSTSQAEGVDDFYEHPERVNKIAQIQSTMADPDYFRSVIEEGSLNIKKSEYIAINFLDLIEETEEPFADVAEMSVENDFDDLKALTKRMNIDDIIKGAKLSAIKRGFKENAFVGKVGNRIKVSSPLIRQYGNSFTDDEFHGYYDKTYAEISHFVERVFKRIDRV